jgi:uncharacterized protein
MTKQRQLERRIAECGSVCIGYSGGVDSVFLAITALDVLGPANVLAVTGRSASYPDVQWATARAVAAEFKLPHLEIDTDELRDDNYLSNPTNRCYFCKTELWSKLVAVATRHHLNAVIDGSNADDAHDHRPGAQAAREHGVISPMLEAGLTKAEIRLLSRTRGLPTWDQPSAPCLSSRVPYGTGITPEVLRRIELAEQVVRAVGIREFRVRYHGDIARLEVATAEMASAVSAAAVLVDRIMALGFSRVLLDVQGYRQGSLNEPPLVQLTPRAASHLTMVAADETRDIAVLDGPLTALGHLRSTLPAIRHAGFRFAAVDLAREASCAPSRWPS